jgi:hypothetical protein
MLLTAVNATFSLLKPPDLLIVLIGHGVHAGAIEHRTVIGLLVCFMRAEGSGNEMTLTPIKDELQKPSPTVYLNDSLLMQV